MPTHGTHHRIPDRKAPTGTTARRRGYLAAALLALLIAGVLTPLANRGVDAPDATVRFTVVPSKLHAGKGALVEFFVGNRGGGALEGAEIRLYLVDESEPAQPFEVARVRGAEVGPYAVPIQVPVVTSAGPFFLRVQVLPVKNEKNLRNNVDESGPVEISKADLVLLSEASIAFHVGAGNGPAQAEVLVGNQGTPGSVLVFTAETDPAAPWLDASPTTAFAVAGAKPATVTLTCDPSLLGSGSAQAMVAIRNFDDPGDETSVAVSAEVGPTEVAAGCTVRGTLAGEGDQDVLSMQGVKGQRARFHMKVLSGSLVPRVTLIDPDGLIEKTLAWKKSKKGVWKSAKLGKSGTYTLAVHGEGGESGEYQVKIGRKLPKKAKKRKLWKKGPGPKSVEIRALKDSAVDLHVTPNKWFEGPILPVYTLPDGTLLDIQPQVVEDGSLHVVGLPIEVSGSYVLTISGFGSHPKARAKFKIVPHPPPKTPHLIVLP